MADTVTLNVNGQTVNINGTMGDVIVNGVSLFITSIAIPAVPATAGLQYDLTDDRKERFSDAIFMPRRARPCRRGTDEEARPRRRRAPGK